MSASFGTKTASTRTSGFEKIIGRHEFLDRRTDSFSALYIDLSNIYDLRTQVYASAKFQLHMSKTLEVIALQSCNIKKIDLFQ